MTMKRLDPTEARVGVGMHAMSPGLQNFRDDERAERLNRALSLLNLPRLYADASLADFPASFMYERPESALSATIPEGTELARAEYVRFVQLARRWLAAWAETPKLAANVVILQGNVGSGKTHFACALANEFVRAELGVCYFRALGDLVREIRETWRRDSTVTESAVLAKYRTVPLLAIDDVSRHAFVGEPTAHLFEIVAAREANALPTILTTNEMGADLAALLGAPLLSRAAAYRARLTFPSVDMRLMRGTL